MTKQLLANFGVWREGAFEQGVELGIGGVRRATAPGHLWRGSLAGASKPRPALRQPLMSIASSKFHFIIHHMYSS
jgi:hypothetical protein